ncbi:MAG: hypothetical protein QXI11_07960 [Thermoproteota archaeon]
MRRVKLFGDKMKREDDLTANELQEVEEGKLKLADIQFETDEWVTWASVVNVVAKKLDKKVPVEDWSDEEIKTFVNDFNSKPLAFRIRNGVWHPNTIEGHIQAAHRRLDDVEIEEICRVIYETGRCPLDGWRR